MNTHHRLLVPPPSACCLETTLRNRTEARQLDVQIARQIKYGLTKRSMISRSQALGMIRCKTSPRSLLTLNRTNKSTSTANTSASDRYSYQSTEPSSIESRSQDDLSYRKQQSHSYPHPSVEEEEPLFNDDRPRQRHKFSLTGAAGKNFSIPRPRFSKSNSSPPRKDSDAVSGRDRSMTTSSYSSYASTAHPPRLDVGLDMGSKDAGNTSGLWLPTDHWKSPIAEEPAPLQPLLPPLPAARRVCAPSSVAKQC